VPVGGIVTAYRLRQDQGVLCPRHRHVQHELIVSGTLSSYGAYTPHHNRFFQSGGSATGQSYFLSDLPETLVRTDLDIDTDFFDGPIDSFRD